MSRQRERSDPLRWRFFRVSFKHFFILNFRIVQNFLFFSFLYIRNLDAILRELSFLANYIYQSLLCFE